MAYVDSYRHFLTRERGRALLAYVPSKLREPFKNHEYQMHGNQMKALYIPRALNELGYVVDYIDWQDTTFKAVRDYDLFVGHGGFNFKYISEQLKPATKRIYFASGYYWRTFNDLEAARFDALEARRGVRLPPDRKITTDEEYALTHSDGILCLGNHAPCDSYSRFPNVYSVPGVSIQSVWDGFDKKDYARGRTHFLFYSGDGNVHKGLDLLLEAFAGTDLHLHICQPITPEFRKAYARELKQPNIHDYGKVNLRSEQYTNLVMQCNWIISASCCEGSPNSVLEGMSHGLIPIVTETCGVDIDDFGILLSADIPAIRATCLQIAMLDAWAYQELSRLAQAKVESRHTPMAFLEAFRNGVRKIMDES